MRATLIAPVTVLVYALHQDFWFWHTARPLVFGFLPIGLFYHAAYTALISLFMWYLVRAYWPAHLEESSGDLPDPRSPRDPRPRDPRDPRPPDPRDPRPRDPRGPRQ